MTESRKAVVEAAAAVKRKNIPFNLDEQAFYELVCRVAGKKYADFIEVRKKKSESGFDEYVISQAEKGLRIEATSGSAAAVAFNRYLRQFCGYNIGINITTGSLPANPPRIDGVIREKSRFHYRYFLNYCTFGYSYAFFDAEQWNSVVDRILLHGYNLVLNPIAQEYVWFEFLKRLDYSDKSAKEYLVSPAYMPWFLMGNMHSYDSSGYTEQWFADRKRIAGDFNMRMQKFGCGTLIPGFWGMVPDDIGSVLNGSSPCGCGASWSGFARPAFITGNDINFKEVARLFYECQSLIEGTDGIHYYSADPFHEGCVPEGTDLAELGSSVYAAMREHDSDAVWVLQGWQSNSQREMLKRLDKSHILVQNLVADITFDAGDNFADSPWLYCTVNNYGGQHKPRGSVCDSLLKPYKAVLSDECTAVGVGLMPESTETDEIFFDIVSDIAIRLEIPTVDGYIKDFVRRRYGEVREDMLRAWKIMSDEVYGNGTITAAGVTEMNEYKMMHGSAFCVKPGLDCDRVSTWDTPCVVSDQSALRTVVEIFAQNTKRYSDNAAFVYDAVDFARQLLAEDSWKYVYAIQSAFKDRKSDELRKYADEFLRRFDLMENLLACCRECLLGNWLDKAKNYGAVSDNERDWLEQSARRLITLWAPRGGDELHDYAAREYSGMMCDFYKKRWERFLDRLVICLEKDIEFEEYDRYADEEPFVYDKKSYPTKPHGNLAAAIKNILMLKNIGNSEMYRACYAV